MKTNVEYRADDHAVVGQTRINVMNWGRCQRQVRVSWPSIGAVDLATARRFAADLRAAIKVAERFAKSNDRQRLAQEP